ncbi:MAG: DUF1289 domain-containing protein, partial [Pseudomonadota bacterium]
LSAGDRTEMGKVPSPCIDVCKFKLNGHCIGCGMSKSQKKKFKKLDGNKARRAFFVDLVALQESLGIKTRGWIKGYRKRCAKKGVDCPLDEFDIAA